MVHESVSAFEDIRNVGIFLPCNVVFQKGNFKETIQNKRLISISFFQRKYWDKTLPCGFHLTAQNWLMSGSMTVKSKEFRYNAFLSVLILILQSTSQPKEESLASMMNFIFQLPFYELSQSSAAGSVEGHYTQYTSLRYTLSKLMVCY